MEWEELHKKCTNNKSLIKEEINSSCFYCKERFLSTKVTEYTDNEQTAICPLCRVDAVLAGDINIDILNAMHSKYFS
jgi:hypothetical protein